MNHVFIDETFPFKENDKILLLMHRDYDIEKRNTLDQLPSKPGIVAICGRVNGRLANCRMVRLTDDIQLAVKKLYDDSEADSCLMAFMRSIKTKVALYKILDEQRENNEEILIEWTKILAPVCTEEMNKVY